MVRRAAAVTAAVTADLESPLSHRDSFERPRPTLLRADFLREAIARGAASVVFLAPLAALGAIALVQRFPFAGPTLPDAALFGAFLGVGLAAVAAFASWAELWIEAAPVVGPDRILAASAVVFMGAAVLLALVLGRAAAAAVAIRTGAPLAALSFSVDSPMAITLLWLRDPACLCALAAPIGALSAVRGDDADGTRPFGRELLAVSGLATGAALLTALVFFLMSIQGAVVGGFWLEGALLRLVFVPLMAAALTTAARLGDRLEARAHRWLEGRDAD